MTAAEQPSEFQSSLLMDEPENSAYLATDKLSDSSSSNFTNSAAVTTEMDQEKNSLDSKGSELSGTDITKDPETIQCSPSNEDSNVDPSVKCNEDEWLDILGSGDFKKKVIKRGLGDDTRPIRTDRVTVDVSYYVNNLLIEEKKDLSFIVGDLDVIQGIDLAISLMEQGEIAKLKIPTRLAYGINGLSPNVPPNADMECEIELKEIEPIDRNSLSVTDRLLLGDEKRSRGNFFYGRGEYIDAIHCYERAGDYLDGVRNCSESTPELLQEVVNMRLKVYNNTAACHLKLSAYGAALKSVESVLKVQPNNVKALYRKGKILGIKGSTDEAIACMIRAAMLEPETKVIQSELMKLRNRRKKDEEHQRAMYQRMFKSEPKKASNSFSSFRKWSMISCGVLAVAIGSAVAYRQLHT